MSKFWKDALERAFWSFLVGALVLLPADYTSLTDKGLWVSMGLSGLLGVLSLVKSIAFRHVGVEDSGGIFG